MKFFKFLPIIFLLVYAAIVFHSLLKGLLPIPADTIVGLYHPWRDQLASSYAKGVPFKNFLITDPVRQQYPWRELAIDLLKKGEMPSWNPYTFVGTPLLANIQTAAFYPLNLIYWLTPFSMGWSLQILLQTILGGLFMFLYLRHLKLHSAAQTLGVLSWIGSGFFVAWLEWNTLVQVAIWIPLILLSIDHIFAGKRQWSIILTFSLICSFFAGHLQIFFYVFLLTFAYLLKTILKEKKYSSVRFFLLSYLLFFIFSSIQWLPMVTLFQEGIRTVGQGDWQNPGWFLPWQNLAQFLSPDFFGNPATGNYFGIWNYGEFVGYIGIIPLVFSFFAFRRKNLFWVGALVTSLVLVLPNPIAQLPFRFQLPLIANAQPTRLLVLTDFSLAMLAALGLDAFLTNKKSKIWPAVVILTSGLGLLWLVAWRLNLAISLKNLILPTGIIFVGLTAIKFRRIFVVLLLTLVLLDLSRFASKFESFSQASWLYPDTKITKFLQDQSKNSLFRVVSLDDRIFPPNFSAHYRLQMISGYDSIVNPNYIRFVGTGGRIAVPKNISDPQFSLLGVRYFLSFDDLDPKSYSLVLKEGQTKLWEAKNFSPRARLTSGEAVIQKYLENQIIISTTSTDSGQLILFDAWYPAWQADVDGKQEKILPYEKVFRRVTIPKGSHLVRFQI